MTVVNGLRQSDFTLSYSMCQLRTLAPMDNFGDSSSCVIMMTKILLALPYLPKKAIPMASESSAVLDGTESPGKLDRPRKHSRSVATKHLCPQTMQIRTRHRLATAPMTKVRKDKDFHGLASAGVAQQFPIAILTVLSNSRRAVAPTGQSVAGSREGVAADDSTWGQDRTAVGRLLHTPVAPARTAPSARAEARR